MATPLSGYDLHRRQEEEEEEEEEEEAQQQQTMIVSTERETARNAAVGVAK